MQIKDLSVDLSAEAQAAVVGGGDINQAEFAGQFAAVGTQANVLAVGSNNLALLNNDITQTQNAVNLDVYTETNTATAVGGLLGIAANL